jgi:hypothetical protein
VKRSRKRGTSTVVLVRDAEALDKAGRPRAKVVARMLDQAVAALLSKRDPAAAWRQLLKPDDLLGIKTNVWKYLPTPSAVESHLARMARMVGIPKSKVRVDDRGALRTLRDCSALINTRPLRSHHWAGIGGCIKNYIMFVPRPQDYHDDACAPLGAVWNLPIVSGKTRLNVLVLLTPQFHGRGPHHFSPQYVWRYNGLLVSPDPVAADAVGVEILKAKRREHFGRDKPFSTRTTHVQVADKRYGIGNSDLKRIKVIRLGDKEGILLPDKV